MLPQHLCDPEEQPSLGIYLIVEAEPSGSVLQSASSFSVICYCFSMIVDLWLRYILVHWFFCTERGQCDKIAALGDNTIFSLIRGVI